MDERPNERPTDNTDKGIVFERAFDLPVKTHYDVINTILEMMLDPHLKFFENWPSEFLFKRIFELSKHLVIHKEKSDEYPVWTITAPRVWVLYIYPKGNRDGDKVDLVIKDSDLKSYVQGGQQEEEEWIDTDE